MPRTVQCAYLKKEAEGLDFPPYPVHTELGKKVWESVSKEAWAAWMKHQTMLVNENRLNLADLRARQYLMRQADQFFFGTGAEAVAGYVPPAAWAVALRAGELAGHPIRHAILPGPGRKSPALAVSGARTRRHAPTAAAICQIGRTQMETRSRPPTKTLARNPAPRFNSCHGDIRGHHRTRHSEAATATSRVSTLKSQEE